jgi:hypothetical protein
LCLILVCYASSSGHYPNPGFLCVMMLVYVYMKMEF